MHEGNFTFPKTGRYYSIREISGKEEELWIVLHGYKQLAKNFIKKFSSDFPDSINIIAPEGMHRFYLEGYRGRVGASWMTSEDRENDISDNIRALDIFLETIMVKFDNPPKVKVLGFSQGAATATRWVCRGESKIDRLVLWAGSFPPDINFDQDFEKLKGYNLTVVLGDRDEFFDGTYIKKIESVFENTEVKFQVVNYVGGHDIDLVTFRIISL